MEHRIAFIAAIAAALVAGTARAEGPLEDFRPMAGTLTRAEVQADLMKHRAQVTSYAAEWMQQQPTMAQARTATTREEVRAAYIAARDEVRAMNAEDSGSGYLAHQGGRAMRDMMAEAAVR